MRPNTRERSAIRSNAGNIVGGQQGGRIDINDYAGSQPLGDQTYTQSACQNTQGNRGNSSGGGQQSFNLFSHEGQGNYPDRFSKDTPAYVAPRNFRGVGVGNNNNSNFGNNNTRSSNDIGAHYNNNNNDNDIMDGKASLRVAGSSSIALNQATRSHSQPSPLQHQLISHRAHTSSSAVTDYQQRGVSCGGGDSSSIGSILSWGGGGTQDHILSAKERLRQRQRKPYVAGPLAMPQARDNHNGRESNSSSMGDIMSGSSNNSHYRHQQQQQDHHYGQAQQHSQQPPRYSQRQQNLPPKQQYHFQQQQMQSNALDFSLHSNNRSSSRVSQPPGGASSFSLGWG